MPITDILKKLPGQFSIQAAFGTDPKGALAAGAQAQAEAQKQKGKDREDVKKKKTETLINKLAVYVSTWSPETFNAFIQHKSSTSGESSEEQASSTFKIYYDTIKKYENDMLQMGYTPEEIETEIPLAEKEALDIGTTMGKTFAGMFEENRKIVGEEQARLEKETAITGIPKAQLAPVGSPMQLGIRQKFPIGARNIPETQGNIPWKTGMQPRYSSEMLGGTMGPYINKPLLEKKGTRYAGDIEWDVDQYGKEIPGTRRPRWQPEKPGKALRQLKEVIQPDGTIKMEEVKAGDIITDLKQIKDLTWSDIIKGMPVLKDIEITPDGIAMQRALLKLNGPDISPKEKANLRKEINTAIEELIKPYLKKQPLKK